METFFQSHAYLVEHTNSPIRRGLMDTIDWSYRLIGIRGSRGVGRTQFLLTYAKENFDPRLRQCLYANMNSFYFQGRKLVDFAAEFIKLGGQVLLIDQAFKLPNWREQIIECYNRFPYLRIVYSTTSVRGGDNDHTELNTLAQQYWLHGFSFREFINLRTGENFRAYTLKELLEDHKSILKSILPKVRPWEYFQQYLHHGYYPFFLESSNFTEQLLRAMNTMIEIDILFIKQIELKYLERIKKLLYLLAVSDTNGSQREPSCRRNRYFARHGDELFEVSRRSPFGQPHLQRRREFPQEACLRAPPQSQLALFHLFPTDYRANHHGDFLCQLLVASPHGQQRKARQHLPHQPQHGHSSVRPQQARKKRPQHRFGTLQHRSGTR